jgi:long-subunit acyl-CoA synthetase (AMP-forming)
MLHSTFCADLSAVHFHDVVLSQDDVHLSYLPLAHVFE